MSLILTDGSHFIKAFEYRHINMFDENILPGTKIQICGRITYYNKVLFLGN